MREGDFNCGIKLNAECLRQPNPSHIHAEAAVVTSTLRVVTWMLTRVASSDSGQAGVSKGNLEVRWSIGSTPQMADTALSWGSSALGREESPSQQGRSSGRCSGRAYCDLMLARRVLCIPRSGY
jgi:hypothetical protein